MAEDFVHIPVLASQIVEWLTPALHDEGPLVDCTVGAGGHSEAFLAELAQLKVIAVDQDAQALAASAERLAPYRDRVTLIKANFSGIAQVVGAMGCEHAGAVLYDLGVSSPQLGRMDRGFGYHAGFSLDMRMDQSSSLTAADIVNKYSENELTALLFRFGEERFARRIAREIVRRREAELFTDAGDLAEVVKLAIPAATRRTGPHPARRTFQALRIETNRELEALEASLAGAVELLRPGGRIAVLSYHSLEDRIVKRAFGALAKGCICPRDVPFCVCGNKPTLQVLTARAVRPSETEIAANPRSQSARLRVAAKVSGVS